MKKPILLERHSHHTPQIAKGTYQVGTSVAHDLHYDTAAAMWRQGHVIVNPNGKVVGRGFNNPKTWQLGQKVRREDLAATYRELYGGLPEHPAPRRREAIEHTRRKLGL
jgi:hypothetical protein